MKVSELQKLIDENLISTKEQMSFIEDGLNLNYKLYQKELDDNDMKTIAKSGLNIKIMKFINDDVVYEKGGSVFVEFDDDIIDKLIEEGELDRIDSYGKNALMWSIIKGRTDIFKKLLPYYKAEKKLDIQDNNEWTPLMLALTLENKEMVDSLIKAGAKVDFQNDSGWTALMYASHWAYKDIVKLLIEAGAGLDIQNNNGKTALMLAIDTHRKDIVELLIEADASLDIQDNDGKTALMLASDKYFKYAIGVLTEAGAK